MRKILAFNIGEEFTLGENQPGIGTKPAFQTVGNFISAILPNVYIIASVILFILLIVGGITVITNAGKGEQEGVQKGQKAITAALVGFLIIFASYWIIQIIEILTGVSIFQGTL